MKQKIIQQLEKITNNTHSDEREIIFQLKNVLFEAESKLFHVGSSKSINSLVAESVNQLNSGIENENVIPTGFSEFDNLFGGFTMGEFIIIGGRPSMGKTQLLVSLAMNIALTHPVLYFSFDLSDFILTNRFISFETNIAINKLLQNNLNEDEKSRLYGIEDRLKSRSIFINDSCHSSIHSFKAECEKQITENGVKLIFVDYIQMMSTHKYRNSRELEIGYISRELKNLAKQHSVCIIATSQLSRAVEQRGGDKRPQLSDLRESGAIEQDADKVIFVYRPEYYGFTCDEDGNSNQGVTELLLRKNRNGKLGTVCLSHRANFSAITKHKPYSGDFQFSQKRIDEIDTPF